MQISRLRTLLLVTLTCVFSYGCAAQKSGSDLALAGVKSSDQLAGFYDTLADQMSEKIDLQMMDDAIVDDTAAAAARAAPPPPAADAASSTTDTRAAIDESRRRRDEKDEASIASFRRRARLARRLSELYTALGNLSANPAKQPVQDAAKSLSTAVRDLATDRLKVSGADLGPDPSDLLSMIAGDLVTLQNSADIRTASAQVAHVLSAVQQLFEKEQQANAYRVVFETRADLAGVIAETFVTRGWTDPPSVLRQFADAKGIPFNGTVPADDASARNDASVVARRTLLRSGEVAAKAGDAIGSGLAELARQHQAVLQTGKFSVTDVIAFADRTKDYLDEIEKLRKEAKDLRDQGRAEASSTTQPSDTPRKKPHHRPATTQSTH